MKTSRIVLGVIACLAGVICLILSCKKEAPVAYTNISLKIGLVDYSFAPYASGTWSTGTKIRVKYAGVVLDSLTSLYGAFNLPRSTPISNACSEPMNTITHSFRIQNNVLNTFEFSDQSGVRITYDLSPTAIYLSSSSDSTTSTLSNANCHLSVYPVR
jgi:hypothetical protein